MPGEEETSLNVLDMLIGVNIYSHLHTAECKDKN
jgi:hypothetical protein